MSIEVARATGPGTVKLFSGRKVNIDGAIFQVESVDMRSKKITLGVVNESVARDFVQQTSQDNVSAPKLGEKKPEPEPEQNGNPEPENPADLLKEAQ